MSNPEAFRQFVKFAMIGGLNTAVHYLIFLVLFRFVGIYYIAASAIGYCAGITNSYFFNRRWTFRSEETRQGGEFGKFTLVNVASVAVNLWVLQYCVGQLMMRPEFGQIGAIGFSMVTNFIGNKFWTFRKMKEKYCVQP